MCSVMAASSRPTKRLRWAARLFGGESAESGHALFDGCGGDGVCGVQCPAARARPRRKRKQVQVAEGQRANEGRASPRTQRSVSPGKPTMTSAPRVRSGPAARSKRSNLLRVVPGPVAAVHAAQHRIGARLQRQVRVAGEAIVPPNSRIRPINSSSQSMGSMELRRRRGSAVCSRIARTSPRRVSSVHELGADRVPSGRG